MLKRCIHPCTYISLNIREIETCHSSYTPGMRYETLRDLLYWKVKNSNLTSYDIHMYNSLNEGDPKKSYQTLRDMIRRHIERQTEDKMLLEKEKAVKNVANIFQSLKPGGPAPKAKATPAPNDPKKPTHREQEERLRKRHLSSQPPIRKDIRKTKRVKEKEMVKTGVEVLVWIRRRSYANSLPKGNATTCVFHQRHLETRG